MRGSWWCLPAVLGPLAPQGQEAMPLDQVLAKILRLFMANVTWPVSGDRPLRVVVLGGGPFRAAMEDAFGQGTVGGRKVSLRFMTATAFLNELPECDAVFIDRWEEGRLEAVLAKTKGRPILTLGRGEGLVQRGVMVNFYVENARIHFELSPTRMKEAALTLNSHLYRVGKIVD